MEDEKIIKLHKAIDSAYYGKTVADGLKDALKDVETEGTLPNRANKVLILFLDNTDQKYNIAYQQVNLLRSEIVALTSVFNNVVARELIGE